MVIYTLIVLIIDFISKLLVCHYLFTNESIILINNFLSITYVKNAGAAWSIFDDKSFVVLILSGIIILGIICYIVKEKPSHNLEKIAYSFILGGAIGNFIDRIVYGYVIDFIDINILGYNYPIFNLADVFIVIGVVLLVIFTWRWKNGDKRNR